MSKRHCCRICLLYMIQSWEDVSLVSDHFCPRLEIMECGVIARVMLIIFVMSLHIVYAGVDTTVSVDVREELHQAKVVNYMIYIYLHLTNSNLTSHVYKSRYVSSSKEPNLWYLNITCYYLNSEIHLNVHYLLSKNNPMVKYSCSNNLYS